MENKTNNIYQQPPNSEEAFKNDLRYIKNDVIAKQVNGLYCKLSKILKCITVVDITPQSYTRYWTRQYEKDKENPERVKIIEEACKDKLENGLVDLEDLIKIQKELSGDSKEETKRILKEVTKKEIKKSQSNEN